MRVIKSANSEALLQGQVPTTNNKKNCIKNGMIIEFLFAFLVWQLARTARKVQNTHIEG